MAELTSGEVPELLIEKAGADRSARADNSVVELEPGWRAAASAALRQYWSSGNLGFESFVDVIVGGESSGAL